MFLLFLACSHTPTPPAPPAAVPDALWVSAYASGVVLVLDAETGAVLESFPGVEGAQAVRFGPDGTVYAVAEERGMVLRLEDGAFEPFLVGLDKPTGLVIGETAFYVADYAADTVVAFEPDGSLRGVVASGIDGPDAGMVLVDDRLVVPAFEANAVFRVDPGSGAVERWLEVPSPRVVQVHGGTTWLTSWRGDSVRTVVGDTTEPFVAVERPSGLYVDDDGVFVTSDQRPVIRLFSRDGEATGTFRLGDLGYSGLTFLTRGPRSPGSGTP
ncbi:MAG: hypothetical protein H6737_11165 [Alphaproteobacteria bacterium]|nr:hypothetical protein [Alphaproteobacteria bacterium]